MTDYFDKYYEGVFIDPENNECRIVATLYIDKKGHATISSLQELSKDGRERNANIKVVFGYLSCNENSKVFSIKLFDLYRSGQTIASLNKYKYFTDKVYISDNFDQKICEKDLYNTLLLSSKELDNWVDETGFDYETPQPGSFELKHIYKQPKEIGLFENEFYKIYIYFSATASFPIKRASKIAEQVFLNVELKHEKDKDFLIELRKTIDRLLSILLDTPLFSSQIEMKVDKITYKRIKKENNHSHNSFSSKVSFDTFKNKSELIFNNWFSKQNELALFIKNYFSVFGRKGVLIENRFLTYISVLENYHKNRIKRKDYLKDRLIYIIINSKIKGQFESVELYADVLVKTRNYHAHLDETKEKLSLSTEGIIKANRILEFLIRELLLNELEVEPQGCRHCSFEIIKNQ